MFRLHGLAVVVASVVILEYVAYAAFPPECAAAPLVWGLIAGVGALLGRDNG